MPKKSKSKSNELSTVTVHLHREELQQLRELNKSPEKAIQQVIRGTNWWDILKEK